MRRCVTQKIDPIKTLYLTFLAYGVRDALSSWKFKKAHTVFTCFVFIWEQTATCATYSINWLVFITEKKCLQRGTDWTFK